MVESPESTLKPAGSRILHEGLLKAELTEDKEPSSFMMNVRLRTIMPQLYDVESSYSEPEKSLPLDLGLDQIEDCQE